MQAQASVARGCPDLLELKVRDLWHAVRSQSAAFLCACAYLVFEYTRPQSIWPIIDILPFAQMLLIGGLFLAMLDRSSTWRGHSLTVLLFAFVAMVLVSSVFAFSPSIAFAQLYIVVGWVFAYLLITSVVTTRDRLILLVIVFLLCNLKMAQHGFLTWAGRGFGFASWGVTGSPGWFQNSGEFGIQMCIFTPLALYLIAALRDRWARWKRWLLYLVPMMSIGSILASSSRGAVVGIVAVGSWMLIQGRARIRGFAVLIVACVVAWQFVPADFKDRFESMGEDGTSQSRLEFWEYGIQSVRDNPLFGIGYANWQEYMSAVHPELVQMHISGRYVVFEAHSTYVEAAAELGLIGFLVYLSIIIVVFAANSRSTKLGVLAGDELVVALGKGLLAGWIGFLVSSAFISTLYYPFIWIHMALTVSVYKVAVDATRKKPRPSEREAFSAGQQNSPVDNDAGTTGRDAVGS